jgi:hypothetical protein
METGKAIYKLLKDSSDVGAICADRIYPELAQQDADLPFIVYTVTDTTPSATKNATSKLDTARVELYCISGDYEQAMDMGIAVRSALDRQSGTLSGVEVQSIDFDTSDVQFDPDQRVYVLEQTYDVRIQRTGTAQVVTQFPGNTFTVTDTTGDPTGAVNKLVFSDGTVSIDGTTATVASGGGGTLTIQETGDTNSDTADTIEFPEGSVTHDGNDKATISLLAGVITEYGANAGLTDSMFPNGLFGDINQDGTVGTQDMLAVLGNFGATASPGANQVARELERAQAQITDGNGSTFNHLRQKDAADVVTTIEGQGYDVEFFEGVNIALGRGFKSQYGSDTVADATVRRTLYISATPFPTSLASMQQYPLGPYDNQSETLVQTVVDAYLEGLNGNGSIIVIREEVSSTPDKLLDTYTGAAAAYSVRKLDKDYTGNCMRIREDSGDTETDIGFDSSGDLDTAAIATHCGSANGYVVTWYDQSGNSNNATQSTAGNQPQIYNGTAVLTLNNKPAVSQRADNYNGTFAGTGLSGNTLTVIQVVDTSNSAGGTATDTGRALSAGSVVAAFRSKMFLYQGSSLSAAVNKPSAQTLGMWFFKATDEGYQNGTQVITGNAGTTSVGTPTLLGQSGNTRVCVATNELIIYLSDQSTNRTGIETNIDDYYQIPGM